MSLAAVLECFARFSDARCAAVALDFQDAASMVKAVEVGCNPLRQGLRLPYWCWLTSSLRSFFVQLGAVDILQKPVNSQSGRLGTLWQHTLRKRNPAAPTTGGSESINTSSGAGSTAAEPTVCTAGDDLVKAILPDLFEVDLWDEHNTTGTSGEHGSSIDTPETPDISHHLHQDYTTSQSLLSCYQNDFGSVHSGSSPDHECMVTAHSVNSALSPVLVPQVPFLLCCSTCLHTLPIMVGCHAVKKHTQLICCDCFTATLVQAVQLRISRGFAPGPATAMHHMQGDPCPNGHIVAIECHFMHTQFMHAELKVINGEFLRLCDFHLHRHGFCVLLVMLAVSIPSVHKD